VHAMFGSVEDCLRQNCAAGSCFGLSLLASSYPIPVAEINAVITGSSLLLVVLVLLLCRWWRRWRLRRVQVFLSYRVATEQSDVEALYKLLTDKYHLNVWWDVKCLEDGEKWEEGFADGLFGSRVFVPFLSKAALAPFAKLAAGSPCDNYFLEHLLAIEQLERKQLNAIFPVFVGSVVDEATGERANFFSEKGLPDAGDTPVALVDAKALEHLQRRQDEATNPVEKEQATELLVAERSPKAVLGALTAHQGGFLQGTELDKSLELIAKKINTMVHKLASGRTVKQGHDGGLLVTDDLDGSPASGRSSSRPHDDGGEGGGGVGLGSGWGWCLWPVASSLAWLQWLVCLRWRVHRPAGSLPSAKEHRDDVAMLPPLPRNRRSTAVPNRSASAKMAAVVRQFGGIGGGGATGLVEDEERGPDFEVNPILVHNARKGKGHTTKGRPAGSALGKLTPNADAVTEISEVSRYLSRDKKVDMGGATAKSVVMREDHRLALSVAVQRNTTRAERGVTLLGAAQKGRAQRAGTQPSSAGDGLATESMVAEVSAAPEAAKEEEQMTYV
jgi:hypothetical protein